MSWELLADPQVWILLLTLSSIEIVLGIDNLVFISIAVSRLPPQQREKGRKFGIAVACLTRIDRKSVVEGRRVSVGVDLGGGLNLKKKNKKTQANITKTQ